MGSADRPLREALDKDAPLAVLPDLKTGTTLASFKQVRDGFIVDLEV